MERVADNFNFNTITGILIGLDENHSGDKLSELRDELDKFFMNAECREVIYTTNIDKLFFGMRVYPLIDGEDAMNLIQEPHPVAFNKYYVEFDSKLFDPLMGLSGEELTAILIYEVAHIIRDTHSIDILKNNLDMHFTNTGEYISAKLSDNYKELLAFGIKDSIVKIASLFSKSNREDEFIDDEFIASIGFGQIINGAYRKILRNIDCVANGDIDTKLIIMSWILRLQREVTVRRLPAIKLLQKAKTLTGSRLEQREMDNAIGSLMKLEDNVFIEGAFENMRNRFAKKFNEFKLKGIKRIENDVFELNLRLRTAEDTDELMYIIRTVNTDVAILQDYLSEPEVDELEREEIYKTLQELYAIREKASKVKDVKNRYDSIITVVYPEIKDYN